MWHSGSVASALNSRRNWLYAQVKDCTYFPGIRGSKTVVNFAMYIEVSKFVYFCASAAARFLSAPFA